jgi:hypothetical protein
MVFSEAGAFAHDGKRWSKVTKWSPTRRMFLRKVGESEAAPSFQASGRTFYVGLGGVADMIFPGGTVAIGKSTKAAEAAIEGIRAVLGDSPDVQRAFALLAIQAGQVDDAKVALQSAIDGKKTPSDCWLVLADLLWDTGAQKEAKAHYATYVKKGKKKDNPEGMERAKSRG